MSMNSYDRACYLLTNYDADVVIIDDNGYTYYLNEIVEENERNNYPSFMLPYSMGFPTEYHIYIPKSGLTFKF